VSSEQPASSASLPLPELPTHQSTVRQMPLDGDWLGSCIQQHMYGLVLTERACVARLTMHTMELSTSRIPAAMRQLIQTICRRSHLKRSHLSSCSADFLQSAAQARLIATYMQSRQIMSNLRAKLMLSTIAADKGAG